MAFWANISYKTLGLFLEEDNCNDLSNSKVKMTRNTCMSVRLIYLAAYALINTCISVRLIYLAACMHVCSYKYVYIREVDLPCSLYACMLL